jgi:hypothetical protein
MSKKPLPLQIQKTTSSGNSETSQPASPLDLLAAASLPYDHGNVEKNAIGKRYMAAKLGANEW